MSTAPADRAALIGRPSTAPGAADASTEDERPGPVTLRTLQRRRASGRRFACLTCYDATTARWLRRAGVEVLLAGDTAAEVILGLPGTIHAPLDFLVTITAAVKRGAPECLVMADMPFMSYQADDAEALRNAARFMTQGSADIVKLEVDRSFVGLVSKMARAGIAVVAHVGSRPQQTKLRGGYSSVGRSAREARTVIDDAVALAEAGASLVLVEAVPIEVAERLVERVGVPVIGCGAGPACHGQVVVLQDLLGLTEWQPAFARPIVELGGPLESAARAWVDRVRRNELGEHPYRINPEELASLDADLKARAGSNGGASPGGGTS
ncbi:MAG TPA: 3-methyl-2-oxobutanoate hydroxymethyltransferase [Phycisphaerales bacterium]|nr:3-methyl-2-oxobutanoate hydroxymethyltransferase [Phycisphaerales bacterium]HMP35869.1 3-methyl-2-oxobutanoate hydroxymethyltransferase [Phycisphaerales bacterium]